MYWRSKKNEADILSGGISSVTSIIEVSPNLFWMEKFTGLQFTILFRNFFKSIVEADFGNNDCADLRIGELTQNKFFTQPFISIQKDFGYSDATIKNNKPGIVKEFFDNSIKTISMLKKVNRFYEANNG
jgi:glycosyl transferase family 25